jgi:integrase
MRKTITDVFARKVKPPDDVNARLEIFDTVVPVFGLRVTGRGVRSWFLMTRPRGSKLIRLTLGRFPSVSLAAARTAAREALEKIARGEDPRVAQPTVTAPPSFGTVADEFLERAAARTRTYRETRRIIDRELRPYWAAQPIQQITRRDIVQLLDKIADRGAPVMANRTLTVVKRVFAFALDRGVIDASPSVRLKPPGGEERSRERVLTKTELRQLWNSTEQLRPVFAAFIRMSLLTAQRRSEIAGMRWIDLDLKVGVWRLERTKVGQSHEVPLSPQAINLVQGLPRTGPFVFTTNHRRPISGFSKFATALSTASGVSGWKLHDLRRTAATGMAELGVSADHIERVLGHVLPGIRRVYVRHEFLDEKRQALNAWARHVEAVVTQQRPVAAA